MNEMTPGLVIDIEGRINKLEKSLKTANDRQRKAAAEMERRAKQSAEKIGDAYDGLGARIGRAFEGMPAAMKGLGGAMLGGFAGGLAVGGFDQIAQSISTTTREVANLKNEATRAGISTTIFQQWKFLADENRISVDALVDAFKELHLRAGEFFLDDSGAGAEAFKKLGYSAEELKEKLKDPSAAMTEILGKLRNFDQAGRSFLLEEIFGGAGGEQFGILIDQGSDALRDTIARAHEAGAVLDEQLIDRAAELDRKFQALQTSAGNFFKRVVVGTADAAIELADFRETLKSIFANEAEGRAILGDDLFDAYSGDRAAVAENARDLELLADRYGRLAEAAETASVQMRGSMNDLNAIGAQDVANQVEDLAGQLDAAAAAFRAGDLDGEAFAQRLVEIQSEAAAAYSSLDQVNAVWFDGVIGQLGRLGGAIAGVISLANSMTSALASAAGVSPDQKNMQALRDRHAAEAASMDSARALAEANDRFTESETARNTATTASLAVDRERAAVLERAAKAGVTLTQAEAQAHAEAAIAADAARAAADKAARAGGGGGKGGGAGKTKRPEPGLFDSAIRDATALQRQLELIGRTSEEVAALEARWLLLDEAQKRGIPVTDALSAQIDTQAAQVGRLTGELERAEIGHQRFDNAIGGIADSMASALTGGEDLRAGLARTFQQLAQDILSSGIRNAFMSQFGGAGFGGGGMGLLGGMLGGLLGGGGAGFSVAGTDSLSNALRGTGAFFAEGGFTGHGGKYQPAGIVHKGEYVMSKAAVSRIGVGTLERLHSTALRGYSGGGLVGDAPALKKAVSASPRASAGTTQNISLSPAITINASGGTPEQNADLAQQVSRGTEEAMRGLIRDELVRAQLPGNVLSGRR